MTSDWEPYSLASMLADHVMRHVRVLLDNEKYKRRSRGGELGKARSQAIGGSPNHHSFVARHSCPPLVAARMCLGQGAS
jgi:hypothetical protein